MSSVLVGKSLNFCFNFKMKSENDVKTRFRLKFCHVLVNVSNSKQVSNDTRKDVEHNSTKNTTNKNNDDDNNNKHRWQHNRSSMNGQHNNSNDNNASCRTQLSTAICEQNLHGRQCIFISPLSFKSSKLARCAMARNDNGLKWQWQRQHGNMGNGGEQNGTTTAHNEDAADAASQSLVVYHRR